MCRNFLAFNVLNVHNGLRLQLHNQSLHSDGFLGLVDEQQLQILAFLRVNSRIKRNIDVFSRLNGYC